MKKNILVGFATVFIPTLILAQDAPPKPPTKEERLKHVSEKIEKELTLSASQKEKIRNAYGDFFDEMEKLRSKEGKKEMPPPPPPPPVKKEDADRLSKVRDAKIKAVLSAAQYQKYQSIEQTLRPPKPGEKPGKQGPPPAPPKN